MSELLIDELTRALAYPKLRKRIPAEKAAAFVSWVRGHGMLTEAPTDPPMLRSPDSDDDYLLGFAISRRAFLVIGDQHLLSLPAGLPILKPAEFLIELRDRLTRSRR